MSARSRSRRPVTLAKPAVAPDRVIAGGREWRREEDDQPYGAFIGWDLAVKLGVPQRLTPTAGGTR